MKARIVSPERKPDARTPEQKAIVRKSAMSMLGFAAFIGAVSGYPESKKTGGGEPK